MNIVFLSIPAAAFVGCIASAQQPQRLPDKPIVLPGDISGVIPNDRPLQLSSDDLARIALADKERTEAVAHIHYTRNVATAGIEAMKTGILDFATICPWVVEALPLPTGPLEYVESTQTLVLGSELRIRELLAAPINPGHTHLEQFPFARRSLAEAVLLYFNDVKRVARQETVDGAAAELKAAIQAYKELPKEIRELPENGDGSPGKSPDEYKNLDLRRVHHRTRNAQQAVLYSKSGQKAALEIMPKLIPEISTLLNKLYDQTPSAPGELDELLRKHGLQTGPLGDAISAK